MILKNILMSRNDLLLLEFIKEDKELTLLFIYQILDGRDYLSNGLNNRYHYCNLQNAINKFEELNHTRDLESFIKYHIKRIKQVVNKTRLELY